MTLRIRPAREEDVRAIAELHVRSWQLGHQGLFPKFVVDSVSVGDREASWEHRPKGASSDEPILVAHRDGEVLGFASAGLDARTSRSEADRSSCDDEAIARIITTPPLLPSR